MPALPDGHSEGYGGMNQIGLPMTISLVLARQAGVNDPALDRAIERSLRLLRWYVNKGAIPYGDHAPWNAHDDNGKCSCAAVLFDLLGDREATSFFARMATAAYDEREHGHCGNLWNMLWALPGASHGGPLATGAYLKEQDWYYELARNWKGGFVYQKIEPGDENDNYTNWDLTGAYLLSYGLPLKSLYVMGKKPSVVPPLKAERGQGGHCRRARLLSRQRQERVRPAKDRRAAGRLVELVAGRADAFRPGTGPAQGRFRACFAAVAGRFRPLRPLRRLPGDCRSRFPRRCCRADLRSLLKDPDPWMRSLACSALAGLGPQARKASVNDLLALAASKNPFDPRGMAHRAVAAALFDPNPDLRQPGVLHHSLEGVDRHLLYPAMESLLQNDDALARYGLAPYLNQLTDRDLAVMLPQIVKAIEEMAPSDEMFADGIRTAGLDLLAPAHPRGHGPVRIDDRIPLGE